MAAATWGASVWYPGVAQAQARTMAFSASPDGTTLARSFGPDGTDTYVRLVETPGWPTVVRELGTSARSARVDTRRAISTIVHLTDVHVIDAQSPARVEFLDRDSDPPQESVPFESAWRAQETTCTQVSEAMNRQLRDIGVGPITGRPFDVCVSTGDNIDNQQRNELDWFMQLLDGGAELTPNSGDLERYEGVQDLEQATYDVHYWHPDDASGTVQGSDRYKDIFGFPTLPGFLDAAMAPFTTTGIGIPWYSCYGNHDGLAQGNGPANAAIEGIATGPFKVTSRPGMTSADAIDGLASGDPAQAAAVFAGPGRPVTADEDRHLISVQEWIQAHLDSPAAPGPVGHGYTEDALETLRLYYTFPLGTGVLGICLDTVNRGGYAEGSIGAEQLAWLEQQLIAASSTHLDASGAEVTTGNDDQLVVLFSHHNLVTLDNPVPDPAMPSDQRVLSGGVLELLHRFDNVIAWVNGHSHVNRVTPYADPAGATSGFWEISTAAHIDFPQQSRIIELVDNEDGTLSIFGTLVDHAAPAQAELSTDVLALASLSRELGFNDPQRTEDGGLGTVEDRNVELLLPAPFPLGDIGRPSDAEAAAPDDEGGSLAATGGGSAALAALAIGGAAVLRRRAGAPEADDA